MNKSCVDKPFFETKKVADIALVKITSKDKFYKEHDIKIPTSSYLCKLCNHWHLK